MNVMNVKNVMNVMNVEMWKCGNVKMSCVHSPFITFFARTQTHH